MNEIKYKKILNHPDRDEIMSKLMDGESVKAVEKWLQKKHPRSQRLKVSSVTLQSFRTNYLNLKGEVLEDIKQIKQAQDGETKKLEVKAILAGTSPYQEAITKIANQELDVRARILEMDQLMTTRIKHWFDELSTGQSDARDDKIFLEYLNSLRALMQDWKKLIEGVADKRIDHNINITVVQDQVAILKNVIFDVLREMAPNLIPLFVDKMNQKVSQLDYNSETYQSYTKYPALEVLDVEHEEIED